MISTATEADEAQITDITAWAGISLKFFASLSTPA